MVSFLYDTQGNSRNYSGRCYRIPCNGILGPRQSGKTTLARNLFPELTYYNLENPETRDFALHDPQDFLGSTSEGMLIDEFQRVPQLLSYMQSIVDKEKKPGQFILTGSQNFLMMERISQSLAGRIGLFTLLPLAITEIGELLLDDVSQQQFKGFFPRLYDTSLNSARYYGNYIQTHLERDVRQLKNISDLSAFHFLQVPSSASRIRSSSAIRTGLSRKWQRSMASRSVLMEAFS